MMTRKSGLAFLDRFGASDDPLADAENAEPQVSVTTLPPRGVLTYRWSPQQTDREKPDDTNFSETASCRVRFCSRRGRDGSPGPGPGHHAQIVGGAGEPARRRFGRGLRAEGLPGGRGGRRSRRRPPGRAARRRRADTLDGQRLLQGVHGGLGGSCSQGGQHQGHRGQGGEEPAERRADDPAAQRHLCAGRRRRPGRRPDDRRARRERRPRRPVRRRMRPHGPRQDQGPDEIARVRPAPTAVSAQAAWRVRVGEEETSAIFEPAPASAGGGLFVFAHGAGGHMADRGMLAVSERLRGGGLDVVRFNFPYREKESSHPDTMPRLKECIAAVASHARREIAPQTLILGGRSMGGRAASMLAAEEFPCDGLLLLAYPLHPAGKPEELRDTHLAKISMPVLCLNGTRDALCRRDLMEAVVDRLTDRWTMHWLEGADHSFHVLKTSGRSDGDVLSEIAKACGTWVSGLRGKTGGSEGI